MEDVRREIIAVLSEPGPFTARQIYYQLVSRGAIAKTEQEYKGTVVRLLGEMRREGRIPYDAIADNTRWMRKPTTWASLSDALEHTQRTYRRALWNDQDTYVEIWLEKDALAGVLVDVTREYDVPLMVTRGFASLSFLHSAAETIKAQERPAFLYYFGDRDPSGVAIDRSIENGIREIAPESEFYFKRVAVTPEQIDRFKLPTRPTKQSDSRARNFRGESVEVDAIAPADLQAICRECIEQHIDWTQLNATYRAEQAERETLRNLVRGGLPA